MPVKCPHGPDAPRYASGHCKACKAAWEREYAASGRAARAIARPLGRKQRASTRPIIPKGHCRVCSQPITNPKRKYLCSNFCRMVVADSVFCGMEYRDLYRAYKEALKCR